MLRVLACSIAVLVVLLVPRVAHAEDAPLKREAWESALEDAEETLLEDGDLDQEDREVLHLGGQSGALDVHGQSWLSLVGFHRSLHSGKSDVGAAIVLGLAFDRFAIGSVHRLSDKPPAGAVTAATRAMQEVSSPPPPPLLPPTLARECVAAAWRNAGLGSDDARIDAIESRSRASAALPETRLRGMRIFTDAARTTLLATTDAANYYDAVGANLVLEARMTWRLDRLLYAGDEATLERVRLERQESRARLSAKTLEVLFGWARARLSVASGDVALSSPEALEGALRVAESEATLDVLTGGWFTARTADFQKPAGKSQ